jgi:photosystem II stability/assembly factor-like uncharacterized protein
MRRLPQIQRLDPVCLDEVKKLSSSSIFEELCDEIVAQSPRGTSSDTEQHESSEEDHSPTLLHAGGLAHRRRLILVTSVAAALLLVIVVSTTLISSNNPSGRTTTPWRAARALPSGTHFTSPLGPSGTWQLVGDVLGSGWKLATSGPPPSSLTCPSTPACYALAGNFASPRGGAPLLSESLYVSSDFGVTWSVLPMPTGFTATTRLSCADALSCSAGGTIKGHSIFITTTDGGHQWATSPLFGLTGDLYELTCSSGTHCHGIARPARVLPGTAAAEQAAQREFPHESFVTTTDGGLSWTTSPLPDADAVSEFNCYNASHCLVMGNRSLASAGVRSLADRFSGVNQELVTAIETFQRTSREEGQFPPGHPIPENTKSQTALLTNAFARFATSVSRLPWQSSDSGDVEALLRAASALPQDIGQNAAGLPTYWDTDLRTLDIAQVKIDLDIGVGSTGPGFFVRSTNDGGRTWTTGSSVVAELDSSNTLSCSSASSCMALSYQTTPNTPDVIVTSDGGATWLARSFPSDVPHPGVADLSCTSANDCWVSGTEAVPQVIGNVHNGDSPLILGTTDRGLTWTKLTFTVPPGARNPYGQSYQSIGSISCPTASACIALGEGAQGATTTPVYSYVR